MIALDAAEATRHLFDLYADAVYRYAHYVLRDSSEAEDATQEIFIKVLRSWDQFQGRSDPKTWLWSIVRHHLADRQRKKTVDQRLLQRQMAETLSREQPVSEPSIDLGDLLTSLKLTYRQVLVLRYMEDMSTKDIASALGWSEAKVRTTLHRALRTLRLELRDARSGAKVSLKGGEAIDT